MAETLKTRTEDAIVAELLDTVELFFHYDDGQYEVSCIGFPKTTSLQGTDFKALVAEACETLHAQLVLDNPHLSIPPLEDMKFSVDLSDEALAMARPHMGELVQPKE